MLPKLEEARRTHQINNAQYFGSKLADSFVNLPFFCEDGCVFKSITILSSQRKAKQRSHAEGFPTLRSSHYLWHMQTEECPKEGGDIDSVLAVQTPLDSKGELLDFVHQ